MGVAATLPEPSEWILLNIFFWVYFFSILSRNIRLVPLFRNVLF